MPLEIYYPQAPLSEHIHMFWAWDDYAPSHSQERILPHGSMELTINLSEEVFSVQDTPIDSLMVAGARSEYFVIDTREPVSLLSVWFKAGSGHLFFAVPADDLKNSHIPLDCVWGYHANELYEQLLRASSTSARFKVLEYYLCQRLSQAKQHPPMIHYALTKLSATPQHQTIKDIVDDVALSSTQFIRIFREHVGLTPKVYARVHRFQTALHKITLHTEPNWTDIALSCGYYDQAHMINEFRALAGITPSDYAPQDPEHRSNLPYTENS